MMNSETKLRKKLGKRQIPYITVVGKPNLPAVHLVLDEAHSNAYELMLNLADDSSDINAVYSAMGDNNRPILFFLLDGVVHWIYQDEARSDDEDVSAQGQEPDLG
ncbi:hypothetical protein [Deinococcus maricopensis]|uniref:Uncharacterized protein n=1 Tax=Deinococcus maricopensis (strain DSM 21211 / LMG 22137 / NRRL B-23946 / LB-34) TaxID=709986 RepID=E8U320_DEIML|nr:hypothetical protein [Deinococcus maricopensis]ADV65758.1 hypothetical protein Deima_0094 [Deinococcus maricopensis DSM 21211]